MSRVVPTPVQLYVRFLLFYVWFIFIIYILTEFWLRQNSLQKIFTHETRNTKLKQQKVLLVSRIRLKRTLKNTITLQT